MATISSPGIGSGLDVNSIVTKLMASEQVNLNRIQSNESSVNSKISSYGVIQSAFGNLQSAVQQLESKSSLNPMSATSADSTKVSATATSSAAIGTYSLNVTQLAQSQRIMSSAYTDTNAVIGTGSMKITLGTYNSTGNTFTADTTKTPLTINIGSGQQTLGGIRDAINQAGAGVTASVVNDGTGSRLVLTSQSTGAANSMQITTTDSDGNNTDNAGLSQLAFDPTAASGAGKNLTQLQAAQNALFSIDGINITKPSNSVSDAVNGVTFNLSQVTTSPVQVSVNQDSSTLTTNLNAFVKAYNDIQTKLSNQQLKGSTLQNDTTVGALQRQLRSMVMQTLPAYSTQLSSIGISIDKTGVMSLNSSKLSTALAADPQAVNKLFADNIVSSDSRVTLNGSTANTVAGTYSLNITGAPNSATSTSVAGTINGDPNTLAFGNMLTGATGTPVEGLSLKIADGTSGNLGTVTFSRGIASALDNWITSLSADGGTISARQSGLQGQLKRLTADEAREQDRLTQVEKNYRTQFTNLDTMLSSMNATSTYLTQQLASLGK